MTLKIILRAAGLLGVQALCLPLGQAALVSYTNVSAFNSAVSSGFLPLQTLNFESVASGTVIPSGNSVGGVTFNYTLFGGSFQMQVGSTFDTTSGTHYLGTTGDDAFLSGDHFTMTFAQPQQAVGLFVISGGNNLAGDYSLSVTQGTASSSASLDSTFGMLPDTGKVYFLGLVESDPTKTFTSATFSSVGNLGIPFNVDDIVTTSTATRSVPDETSTLGLMLGACAGLLTLWRRRT